MSRLICVLQTNVAAAMYVMGRNSDLTYDQESFIPERWLANDPVLESFYNTVPFGFGSRGCIGLYKLLVLS